MAKSFKSSMIQLNSSTIQAVRKEYNLDKPGMMDQAIGILQDWIQKQEHFVKKDFPRDYLERIIISTKGSVEKAKKRMDKVCTMRTMVPKMFEKCHAKNDFPHLKDYYINLTMPKITDDNYRIFIAKINGKNILPSVFLEGFQHSVLVCEYMKLFDYTFGQHVICDLRDNNIFDFVTKMDLVDLRNIMMLYTALPGAHEFYRSALHAIEEDATFRHGHHRISMARSAYLNRGFVNREPSDGYGFRLKNIYILSESNMIGVFVDILKQMLSAKLGQRISVCKTIESLHEHLPKHLLPEEYGGDQKPVLSLYNEWQEELSSDKVAYLEEMKGACTNEKLRRSDIFNDDYLGMPGSFKMLSVD